MLVLATCLAYSNSFGGPFVFDDLPSIVENPQIRGALALWRVFEDAGRGDVGLAGRPVGAWTFALNHALGGFEVFGYHALNLALHLASGLLLFGLVRRSLQLERWRNVAGEHSDLLAGAAAALFLLHPLQTKAVTFVVQRLESLTGMLLLLTLYAVLRGATSNARPARWYGIAIVACALGMGVKEVMVGAPLLALLFDRALIAGDLRAAWRLRKRLYLGLASTWILLAVLVATSPRWRVADRASVELGVLDNLTIQAVALVGYLRLTLVPSALVFDYGIFGDGFLRLFFFSTSWAPAGALVLALLALSSWGLVRNRPAGFLGAACFVILAPSSSVIPIRLDPIAEHRMYSVLAALAVLAVLGLWRGAQRVAATRAALVTTSVVVLAALTLGVRTHSRNFDYRSARAIWQDTVDKRPGSSRALTNLGVALLDDGEVEAALERQREAVEARPSYAEAHHNLANALIVRGDPAAALESYRRALELEPDSIESNVGAGEALVQLGRGDEAATCFERALAQRADLYGAHRRMAGIRAGQGRIDKALKHLQAALALDGSDPVLWTALGSLYAEQGRFDLARLQFESALRAQPGFAEARAKLERLRGARADTSR